MADPAIDKNFTSSKTKLISIVFLSISLACFLLFVIFTYSILANNKVYNGVFVDDIDVSELKYDDLFNTLNEKYIKRTEKYKLVIKAKEFTKEITFLDSKVKYEIEKVANLAYNIGREGNFIQRLKDIFSARQNYVKIPMTYTYDEKYIREELDKFYSDTLIFVKEADLYIDDSKVTLKSGHPGVNIDKTKTLEFIQNSFKTCSEGTFEIPLVVTMPSSINVDSIYSQIVHDPVNAVPIVENNTVKVIPHQKGRSIDKNQLSSIIKELEKTTDTEKVLPVKYIEPALKTEDVNKNIFKDVLASASTNFSTASPIQQNRGVNIRLGATKINGKLVGPGETFSFNQVVGPRTTQAGYKTANSYIGGKIVPDVGGGICQVSTTLYNAVLFADLEVVSRTNHMFTVTYVPYGQDAAVSYSDLDLKFRNNTQWPIKIESWVSSNSVYFTIKGTNMTPNKTIEISNVQVSTTQPPVQYIDDPTLDKGISYVTDYGMVGHVIDTYKTVKIDNKVVSKTKIHRSYYKTLNKKIRRGTKPPAVAPVSGESVESPPIAVEG